MELGLQKRVTMFTITLLLVTVAGLGTLFLVDRYKQAGDQAAFEQLMVYRTGILFVQDVAQTRSVLTRLSASSQNLKNIERRRLKASQSQALGADADPDEQAFEFDEFQLKQLIEQDLFALTEAVDFLYVRGEEYLRLLKKFTNRAEETFLTREMMEHVLDIIDAGLAASAPDWPSLAVEVQPVLAKLSSQVISVSELQYQIQSQAVRSQTTALDLLIVASTAFLWFFTGVTIIAVFVLRAEIVARIKRREAEDKAKFLAYYDALTGLPNRARFADTASRLLRENAAPTVLLFDLDDFKAVNDFFGHAAGDALLMRVSEVLQGVIDNEGGVCARLGGDEFAAALPGPLSSIKIASVCERLISEIRKPFFHETVQLCGKISIGIAQHSPEGGLPELSEMQKAADTALYRAKNAGKNTYAFYDSELADLAERRREIESGITEALDKDGFTIVLQPQVSMATGQIYGFESLMRLSINGVAIRPDEFISIAEATGQVVEIDLWGLKTAAQTFVEWHSEGLTQARLSCNLSSLHFKSNAIVSQVEEILEETKLDPAYLTLEITESMLLEDIEKVTAILERLRNLGCKIALDDFGTGYSSLSYLRRLSVDIIKIDQSFVRGLHEGSTMRVILEAIVDIAKGLGKSLVVEGIETEDEARIIRGLHCEIGQGYLFGRPMEIGDAQARLRQESRQAG